MIFAASIIFTSARRSPAERRERSAVMTVGAKRRMRAARVVCGGAIFFPLLTGLPLIVTAKLKTRASEQNFIHVLIVLILTFSESGWDSTFLNRFGRGVNSNPARLASPGAPVRRRNLMPYLCYTRPRRGLYRGREISMSGIEFSVSIGSEETKIVLAGPSGIIHSRVLPVAGNTMDEAIAQYLRLKYKLRVGAKTAGVLKSELGTATPSDTQRTLEVRGRGLIDDSLETVLVTNRDVHEALAETVGTIVNAVTAALKSIPAEVSAAVAARGISLKGGKHLPENIEQALTKATGVTVIRA
jgi:MreB/Mbl protein